MASDCSGLEAPILSSRAVQVQHSNVFISESSSAKREYIAADFDVPLVFEDLCRRHHTALPGHDLCVCGLPCAQRSTLDGGSRLFREPNAKSFFAMIATLKATLPAAAVLENILAIRRVFPRV